MIAEKGVVEKCCKGSEKKLPDTTSRPAKTVQVKGAKMNLNVEIIPDKDDQEEFVFISGDCGSLVKTRLVWQRSYSWRKSLRLTGV